MRCSSQTSERLLIDDPNWDPMLMRQIQKFSQPVVPRAGDAPDVIDAARFIPDDLFRRVKAVNDILAGQVSSSRRQKATKPMIYFFFVSFCLCGFLSNRTIAWAAIPSFRPMKPIESVVVAFKLIRSSGILTIAATDLRILSR